MKKTIFLTVILTTAAIFSNTAAQVTPPGAGDKDLRDTNVKGRSNELERIDRDARKEADKTKESSAKNPAIKEQPEDKLAAKYADIKTDFEQIQLSQDTIIKTYQSGSKIDYAQIGAAALAINKSAARLNSNLFPAAAENPDAQKEKKQDETKPETGSAKSIRNLIVELDNSIGGFAASPMFQNLRLIDPKDSIKAKLDLEKIIELSAMLDAVARKTANDGQ